MYKEGERRELKHLSTFRKRKKIIDSESSGERNWNSPNNLDVIVRGRCLDWVVGLGRSSLRGGRRVEKVSSYLKDLGSSAKEGDSPVN